MPQSVNVDRASSFVARLDAGHVRVAAENASVELQLDRSQAVAKLRVLVGERVLVNLVVDSQVQQSVLLCDEQ